ncbi:MAG: 50S ribosomal protein L4 [Zetaproteobacteria bacterium]|nr:MAG: 50S ribosomal protein L4 [Zetaproteobacteria bacterium]
MAQIAVVDQNNQQVGTRELNPAVFGLEPDVGFVHRVFTALAEARRSGTRATKTRAQVSGGGKKPWKQKGTGRARQGSTRATQWRHGGIAHGPKANANFATRINRKERQRALRLVLSDALREGRLVVVNKIELPAIKTKHFVDVMTALGAAKPLVVLDAENKTLSLSGRNVPNARIVLDGQVNLFDLMKCDRVILTEAAVDKIEERLA